MKVTDNLLHSSHRPVFPYISGHKTASICLKVAIGRRGRKEKKQDMIYDFPKT